MKEGRDWLGAGAGLAFIVLTVVGLGMGGSHPSSIGPIEEIKSRFLSSPGPFAIQTSSYIHAVASMVLVIWGVRVAWRLWDAGQQWPAAVAFAGVIVAAAINLLQNSLLSVLAFNIAASSDEGAIRGLYSLRHLLLSYVYFPEALMALAIALGSVVSGALPRWYGWLTAVIGLVFLSGGATLARTGFFSVQGDYWFYVLLLFAVWVLLTSTLLLGRDSARTLPTAQ